jgi:hypothetical protein
MKIGYKNLELSTHPYENSKFKNKDFSTHVSTIRTAVHTFQ